MTATSASRTQSTQAVHTLRSSLKPSWVFALAIGSEVGWGAFILPFDWLQNAGLAGIALGFGVATILIMVVGLIYATAIRALPRTGGGVLFALFAAGRVPGFIAGWSLALGYMGIVALNASAVTLVFRVAFPGLLSHGFLFQVAGWDVYLAEVVVSILFIWMFAFLNMKGFEFSGRFQFWAVVTMLTCIAVLAVMALYAFWTQSIELPDAVPPNQSLVASVFVILAIAPWAFIGFDTIPQMAGEFRFSPAKVIRLMLAGIATAAVVYVLMSLVTAIAVSSNAAQYADSAWPPADALTDLLGPVAMVLMVIAVSAGVLTGLNGFIAASSRVLYTMGGAKMIPAPFQGLSPRFGTPVVAITVVALVCSITPWFGRAALSWIVDMTSAGITVAYFFASFFVVRLANGALRPHHLAQEPSRSASLVALGVAGCLIAVTFLALLLIPASPGALGTESLIALAFWAVLGGALLAMSWRRHRETSPEKLWPEYTTLEADTSK